MEIEKLSFSQAFQRIYLHRHKEPAWKLFELLCGEQRTALQVTYNITTHKIFDVTAYMWAQKSNCIVRCSVLPCFRRDGEVDIWTIAFDETLDEGSDDIQELEQIVNPEFLKTRYNPHQIVPGWDFYQERWYIAEDHGNYDGWIQCLFTEKFLQSHAKYSLPNYILSEEYNITSVYPSIKS